MGSARYSRDSLLGTTAVSPSAARGIHSGGPSSRPGSRLPRVTTLMGQLVTEPALDRPDLLADPVAKALAELDLADSVWVAEIDPGLADTAAFCERYGVAPAESANCVVISGKRGGETRFAACVILATTRA